MTRAHLARLPLACCIGAATLLGACGGSTKTVSVAGEPSPTRATQTTPPVTATAAPTTSVPQTQTSSGGPSTTRTAPEPAFAETTHTTGEGEGASAAAAVVRAHGFTPNDLSQYHSDQTLRVLVGTHTGSGDGYGQQAFFFVQGRYIGTDTASPSATLKVLSQSDTSVTLGYPLYRHNDSLCCPGGGQATVRFELNNGKLAPAQPIPPLHSSSGLSRY